MFGFLGHPNLGEMRSYLCWNAFQYKVYYLLCKGKQIILVFFKKYVLYVCKTYVVLYEYIVFGDSRRSTSIQFYKLYFPIW